MGSNCLKTPKHLFCILFLFLFVIADNHTKLIVGSAVAVGTITAASLAYLYWQKNEEPIPEK